MVTQELYINGQLVDLPNDGVVALSFAVNTLNEVKTAQGNISNRITLPLTANNLRIFGSPNNINIDLSPIIRKKLVCRYVIGGVEVIPEGAVEIGDINAKGIGILITSGNLDFFDVVDGSIRSLDLSEYDHKYDFSLVENYIFVNNGKFTYPILNYGDMTDASEFVDLRNIRPATNVKTIVDHIVKETGFTLINELELNEVTKKRYLNMVVPFSNDSFEHAQRAVDALKANRLIADQTTAVQYMNVNPVNDLDPRNYVDIGFNTAIDESNSFSGTVYTASTAMVVDISFFVPKITVERSNGNTGIARFRLMKNDVTLSATDFYTQTRPITPQDFYNSTTQAFAVPLAPGDTIKINMWMGGNNYVTLTSKYTLKIKPVITNVAWGDTVQLEATLPDISRKDFLKAIANIFCAIIQTDNEKKTVRIVPFMTIVNNMYKAVDWSDKLVDPNEYNKGVYIGDYAQNNIASYKNDEVIYPPEYGQGVVTIADENLKLTEELFELPFSASEDTTIINGIPVAEIKKISAPGLNDFTISTGPRLLMLDLTTQVVTLRRGDMSTPVYIVEQNTPLTYFASQDADNLPDLMLTNIITDNYQDFQALLNDQRKTSEYMILDSNDIASLDFFTPVYVRHYASYFYISKIDKYVAGRPCKVDLIKLS